MDKAKVKGMLKEWADEGVEVRAIYTGDIAYKSVPVFKLNFDTLVFEMVEDKDFQYDLDVILEDNEKWLVFALRGEGDNKRVIALNRYMYTV